MLRGKRDTVILTQLVFIVVLQLNSYTSINYITHVTSILCPIASLAGWYNSAYARPFRIPNQSDLQLSQPHSWKVMKAS